VDATNPDVAREVAMATVSGRVLVRETGRPVPDVIVAAYEVPRHAGRQPMDRRRVGSVVTGPDGSFSFSVPSAERAPGVSGGEDEHFEAERVEGADLVLAVHPPSVAGASHSLGVPLHLLTLPAAERGGNEEFVVFLPQQLLRERGVPPFDTSAEAVAADRFDQRVRA
jgi:hypothetical protein